MIAKPHAMFQRDRHGVTLTIEVNSRGYRGHYTSKTNGEITGSGKLYESLAIRQGPKPFWSYQAGLSTTPIWDGPSGSSRVSSDADWPSYITLLRTEVAMLTSGGLGIFPAGKPRLGFHSRYHAAKRARRDAQAAA